MSFVRRFFHPVSDFTRGAEGDAIADRRQFVYYTIDHAPFQIWVVFVAGIGFITDAYDIFALNVIIPMLDKVYWPEDSQPTSQHTAMFCATLVGTLIGQLLFGVLADLYGRRKMYGLELMVVIMGTIGVAISSRGEKGSMEILGWLVAWRFIMGIGIGGDYPLSAVITSEFAPRRHRARMLAVVFYMQPLGQLLGMVVALVVVQASKPNIMLQRCVHPEDDNCIRTLDSAWRWVVGLGAVPAALAVTFRLTIPESPRYTMDVLNDEKKSSEDTNGYYNGLARGHEGLIMMERGETHALSSKITRTPSNRAQASPESVPLEPQFFNGHVRSPSHSSFGNGTIIPGPESLRNGNPSHSRAPSVASQHTWPGEMLPSPGISYPQQERESMISARQPRLPPPPSKPHPNGQPFYTTGLKDYFITQGNYRSVLGTSITWGLLDFAFYGLGLNSQTLNKDIWPSRKDTLYNFFLDNSTHSLVLTCVGAVIGSAIMIKIIDRHSPKRIQFWGFATLAVLFIVLGPVYIHKNTGSRGAVITLYVLCQMAFYVGPNSTTYMIPAELFPTKWRCTCHGIAAASGKLGSVIAQVFLSQVKFKGKKYDDLSNSNSPWLGYFLLVLSSFMFVGALVTMYLVPEIRDNKGESRSLEVLAGGRTRLAELNGCAAQEDIEGGE